MSRPNRIAVGGDHDAPPPPYSETDIYSNSGGPRSTQAQSSNGRSPDDSLSHVSSAASEVIYTPPLTPLSAAAAANQRQPPAPQALGPSSSPAAFYFESRPLPDHPLPAVSVVHTLDLHDGSRPEDFPYQTSWAAHDVTDQDWATFINFVIPDHASRGNEAVIDRKLRAEAQSVASGGSNDDGTQSHAAAQLGQLREPASESSDATQRRIASENEIHQWNQHFFQPRGVTIRHSSWTANKAMPGSWDPAFDPAGTQAEAGSSRAGQRTGTGSFGPFRVDTNGIEVGSRFKVDKDSVRIGNMIIDQNGIRRTGGGPSDPNAWSRDMGSGPRGQHNNNPGAAYGPQASNSWDSRGRGMRGPDHRHRHRSNSTSSTSSSSSSSSESSIGSLPSFKDVPGPQLPLYVTRLQQWIAHPEEMRTKAEVKQLKQTLTQGKGQYQGGAGEPVNRQLMKAQISGLKQQWRQIKRQQRSLRRQNKRERRRVRRAEKRERRQVKREMKHARKEAKRGRRDGRHGQETHGQFPGQGSYGPGGPGGPGGFMGSFGGPSQWRGVDRRGPSCYNNDYSRGPFGPNGPFGANGPFGGRGPFSGGGPFGIFGPPGGAPPSRAPGAWPEDDPGASGRAQAAAALEQEIARQVAEAQASGDKSGARSKAIEAMTEQLENLRMNGGK